MLTASRVKAVLFDLDGTLADSVPVLKDAYFGFMKSHNVQGTEAEFKSLGGPSLREAIVILQARHRLAGSVDYLYTRYHSALVERYCADIKAIEGAQELIKSLRRDGKKIALVTSASGSIAQAFLKQYDLAEYFDAVVTAEAVEIAKPHPQIYLSALQTLSLTAAETVAVEDSPNGVRSAVAAGIEVFGVTGGNEFSNPADLKAAGASRVFSSLHELVDALSETNAVKH